MTPATTAITPEEQRAQDDLLKSLEGKSKIEQNELIRAYAQRQLGVQPEAPLAPVVQFSEDQFARLAESFAGETRKVVAEAAGELERSHDLSGGAAKSLVEDAVAKMYRDQDRRAAENK